MNIAEFIERFYAAWLYPVIIRPYTVLTGMIPFSIAELLIVTFFMFVFYYGVKMLYYFYKYPKETLKKLPKGLRWLAIFAFGIYLVFQLMWGLNYHRTPFANLSGLHIEDAPVEELVTLAYSLTIKANELRTLVQEDEQGVMHLSDGIHGMLAKAHLGYQPTGERYPHLAGHYGRPKGVILSKYWSYTGIGGMYFPFTGEANINIHQPAYQLPAITTHEMAHQRGFAREDEANFIAYLTATMHPEIDFQYSGVMMALGYTMRELYRYDRAQWESIRSMYSEGVQRDIAFSREYWSQYQGKINELSTKVNDTYLVFNRQSDGVHSYGRMVDLLLAYQRENYQLFLESK